MEARASPSNGNGPRELASRGHNRTPWIAGLTALLIGLLLVLPALPASATVTPGATTALVNAGQPIRESSTAVPIFGITAASNNAADQLTGITITFSGAGFVAGNAGTLLALNVNPSLSGVALYADVGSVPGALDSGDTGVAASGAAWSGSSVVLTYAASFPTVPAGAFDWILAIRTSTPGIASGNQIIAMIPAGGITFSGGVSQPAAPVAANALNDYPTVVADLLAPQTWIGPSYDAVNARAALGVQIVDGGIPTNYGIHDQLHRVVVQLFDISGTFGGTTLAPLSANPATSGIALYRDSNGDGVWDSGDTGVTLTAAPTIDCVGPSGGAALDWCLFPSSEFIPHALTAPAYSYFVVVRSGTGMASGDDFAFQILQRNGLWISGVLPADAQVFAGMADVTSSSLLGDNSPPCITPGCGMPIEPHWANPTSSPYLYPVGHTLYFSHGMGATPVPGEIRIDAQDTESGLGLVTFAPAASLAGSPASQVLSGTSILPLYGNYSFNATSTGASSPVAVTVYDAVGNHASFPFTFILDANAPTITPAPGWNNLIGTNPYGLSPLYVNATGTLWFSPWIQGTATADISVDLYDGVSGLRNATATAEPSLAGGPFYGSPTTFPAGTYFYGGWTVTYAFNASSTDASRPANVFACDNTANCANQAFDYRMDATPPTVTITSPANGATVSGQIVVTAQASDGQSGLAPPPQIEILGQTGFQPMMWNGAAWAYPIPTALFPDGPYRIVVEAFDNVGNLGTAVLDVTFHNSALDTTPPTLVVNAPAPYAYLTGTVTLNVTSTDAGGFGTMGGVWAQLGSYAPIALTASGSFWTGSLNTRGVPDGTYTLVVWSTDAAGNTAKTSFQVTVDNTAPGVAFVAPGSNALVSGIVTVEVSALDSTGVAYVNLTVGTSTYTMASLGNGVYAYALDTTALSTGAATLTVTATDFGGLSTTKTLSVQVDNTPPTISLGSPSSDHGPITLTATVTDSPAGVASVTFIVDGTSYVGVNQGNGVYSVTIFTSATDNGLHSYEVVAVDRAGNVATQTGTFPVNTPPDYLGAMVGLAPLLIFFVLLAALVLALLVMYARRRRARTEGMGRDRPPKEPESKPEEEL